MPASILRYADYTVMPWKNGRGETREIARFPAEGAFAWRLSMATVAEDAAFSEFPGVARTLAVVDGGSLDLRVDGVEHRLELGGEAVTFSGSAPASAKPVTLTVTDLNLMVRGNLIGSIKPQGDLKAAGEGVTIAISLADRLETGFGILNRLDALILDDQKIDDGLARVAGPAYVVRVRER